MISIKNKFLIINAGTNCEYDINLKQLDNKEKLRHWLTHMQEKNWWDLGLTIKMIKLCNNHFGYNYEH